MGFYLAVFSFAHGKTVNATFFRCSQGLHRIPRAKRAYRHNMTKTTADSESLFVSKGSISSFLWFPKCEAF